MLRPILWRSLRSLIQSIELLVLFKCDHDLILIVHLLRLLLLVALDQVEGLLEASSGDLLNQFLDLRDLLLLRSLRVLDLLVRVHARQLVLEVLDEAWVLLEHAKFDDVIDDVLAVHQAEELLALDADGLQLRHNLLRGASLDLAFFVTGEDE